MDAYQQEENTAVDVLDKTDDTVGKTDDAEEKISLFAQIRQAEDRRVLGNGTFPALEHRDPVQDDLAQFFAAVAVDEPSGHKPKRTAKRTIQRKTRLTHEEDELFQARVAESGKGSSVFMREAILYETIQSAVVPPVVEDACKVMMAYSSDLGRISGLLVQTVKTNRDFQVLTYEQCCELDWEIRSLRKLRDDLAGTVAMLNGHF